MISPLTSPRLHPGCTGRTLSCIAGKGRAQAPAAESHECSRLHGAKERTMPSYHCNMLDDHGHVIFPADTVAESLDAAIRYASHIREVSNHGASSSQHVYAFEVWSDSGGESFLGQSDPINRRPPVHPCPQPPHPPGRPHARQVCGGGRMSDSRQRPRVVEGWLARCPTSVASVRPSH